MRNFIQWTESNLLRIRFIGIICLLIFYSTYFVTTEILDEGDSDSNTDQDAGSSEEEEEEEEEEEGEEDGEGKSITFSNNILNTWKLNQF